jgi:hypothetical protein
MGLNVESGVRTLYYGLGIIFMLGGAGGGLHQGTARPDQQARKSAKRVSGVRGRAIRIEGILERAEADITERFATLVDASITFSIQTRADALRQCRWRW